MSRAKLILRNLLYHWRGNLAVLLGIAIGSAVLTGALLVGDSLTGSLRERTEKQLGWVDHVLMTSHLFHEDIALELEADRACPVLFLRGAAWNAQREGLRVNNVSVMGVTEDFWPSGKFPNRNYVWVGKMWEARPFVAIGQTLAQDLGVKEGDKIDLQVPRISSIPRESSLGHRDSDRAEHQLRLTVVGILDDDQFGNTLSIATQTGQPRNAYLDLRDLQQFSLETVPIGSRNNEYRHVANAIFARGATRALQSSLSSHLVLSDYGLVARNPESRTRELFATLAPSRREEPEQLQSSDYKGRIAFDVVDHIEKDAEANLSRKAVLGYFQQFRNYFSLESQQLILQDSIVNAALAAASELKLHAAPTLVYLADSLSSDDDEHPYVLVAAVDPQADEPLIPTAAKGLKDDEILFADTSVPLLRGAKIGSEIRMAYYDPEKEGILHDRKDQGEDVTFKLKGLIPLDGAAADPDMTPAIPGVTDRKDLDWDLPKQLNYKKERLRPEDNKFWGKYRTTPRAYITLKRGQKLWKSRFGKVTSIRISPTDRETFEKALLKHLDPAQNGLIFEPVKADHLKAAEHGTDFSVLFLSFSAFIIVAALLLVGLLFRLNLDRRSTEIGLLLALGYRRSTVRNLLLIEAAILSVLGSLAGLALALAYARGLLWLLGRWWPGHLDHSFLQLHVGTTSLAIGFTAMLVVTILTVFWVLRGHSKIAASALLAGATVDSIIAEPARAGIRTSLLRYLTAFNIAIAALLLALAALVAGFFVHGHEAQAGSFFSTGMLLLVTMLALFWATLGRTRHALVHGHGPAALGRLAVRNAGRNRLRSLLTAGLLACAAFVVVAVQSFRKDPGSNLGDKHSGTGGFNLLAETDLPVYHDLASHVGQKELVELRRRPLQDKGLEPEKIDETLNELDQALKASTIVSCRLKPGDDASCLNLAQPGRPRILGMPESFIDDNRLRFADSLASTPEEKANPWLLLKHEPTDDTIPIIADATTVEWTLHSKLGGKLQVPATKGADNMVTLQIVALLQDSIFQSEVLMSSTNFEQTFPDEGGYRFFLIDAPKRDSATVQQLFADNGYQVTPSRDRLESYLEVENTYLATFQALGSLGLVLGTLGLAIVLLRSVWERRGELALLRALGYRNIQVGWLVLAENAWLLLLGLAAGTTAALVAIAPQLLAGAGSIPWPRLFIMLAIVIGTGLSAATLAIASSLKSDLIPALRRE